MRQCIFVVFGLIAVMCVGCTSVQKQSLNELPQVQSEKGLVYFYREKAFVGGGMSYYVCENGEKLGALQSGTFFFVEPEPGLHIYTAKTETENKVTLEIEKGKTYYIKGEIKMGVLVGQPELTIVHELEGKGEIPNLQYAVLKSKKEI